MRHVTKLKPDATVAGTPVPIMWVLAQVSPAFQVLAASANRSRLVSEMAELYGTDTDAGFDKTVRFAIRPTNLLVC